MNTPDEMQRTAARLRKLAGTKLIRHRGGNLWGHTPTRCTIIPPQVLSMLMNSGQAETLGPRAFRMKPEYFQ